MTDSAGAGTFRGGLGTRRTGAFLPRSRRSICVPTVSHASPGLFGATPAKPSKAVLNPGTDREQPLTSKIAGLRLRKNDVVAWQLAGGGGYGEPWKRETKRVARDVRMGYVTREAARAEYGVVLRADLTLDEEATIALRNARVA